MLWSVGVNHLNLFIILLNKFFMRKSLVTLVALVIASFVSPITSRELSDYLKKDIPVNEFTITRSIREKLAYQEAWNKILEVGYVKDGESYSPNPRQIIPSSDFLIIGNILGKLF